MGEEPLGGIILGRRQTIEKIGHKAVFGLFLENFDQKLPFFGARSPSKIIYIGSKGAFRKISGKVGLNWIS